MRTLDEAIERAEELSRVDRKPQTIWQRQTGEYIVTSYRKGDEKIVMFCRKVDARKAAATGET